MEQDKVRQGSVINREILPLTVDKSSLLKQNTHALE
jgi:hypothetical protein